VISIASPCDKSTEKAPCDELFLGWPKSANLDGN